jgi:hypothetical protein
VHASVGPNFAALARTNPRKWGFKTRSLRADAPPPPLFLKPDLAGRPVKTESFPTQPKRPAQVGKEARGCRAARRHRAMSLAPMGK